MVKDSREEIAGFWQAERRFEPQTGSAKRDSLIRRWREVLERAKGWEKGNPA